MSHQNQVADSLPPPGVACSPRPYPARTTV